MHVSSSQLLAHSQQIQCDIRCSSQSKCRHHPTTGSTCVRGSMYLLCWSSARLGAVSARRSRETTALCADTNNCDFKQHSGSNNRPAVRARTWSEVLSGDGQLAAVREGGIRDGRPRCRHGRHAAGPAAGIVHGAPALPACRHHCNSSEYQMRVRAFQMRAYQMRVRAYQMRVRMVRTGASRGGTAWAEGDQIGVLPWQYGSHRSGGQGLW